MVGNSPLTYDEARSAILSMLPAPVPFEDEDNLIEFGLDSIKVMRIVGKWRKAGARVTFAAMIESPCMKDWWALLNKDGHAPPAPEKSAVAEPASALADHGPFPLTDVQYAYWIGRRDDQPLGGVGCHAYLEIDGRNVDPTRLQAAWRQVTGHHPMLRARFLPDGHQEIPDTTGVNIISIHDLRTGSEDDVAFALKRTRDRLSHRRLAVEKGEVIGLEISLLPDNKTRLHFDVDLLVADVQSLNIILRDLAAAYARECPPPAPENWHFGAYLRTEDRQRREERERAGRYWRERLPDLPGAPGLPLKQKPEEVKRPVFKRRTHLIARGDWARLQQQAAAHRVTPAMLLLTAYAEILDRWSSTSRFFINIPLFDRQTEETGIDDVVADFTNLLLLAVDFRHTQSFQERVNAIQARFHADVANAAYSGVQVQRDLAQIRQGERMVAPVVFASTLGTPLINDEYRDTLGQLTYMITQTPQVWLDFQIHEVDGALLLAWDAVDALFPDGLIDDMFTAYARLIEWLAKEENDWESMPDLLPVDQRKRRDREIAFAAPSEEKCLHIPFFDHAAAHPDRVALIDSQTDTHLAYGDLATSGLRVAALLREHGVREGEPVAITLPRGIDQITAVLGVLASGACYVPVSMEQPATRRERIHCKAAIRCVLTNGELARTVAWPGDVAVLDIADSMALDPLAGPADLCPEHLSYIIFTSGSTGEPKGVEMSHGAAWNTIAEINRRYDITATDRVLAVSALDFDLSVYDLFGLLGEGGALVLIPEDKRRDAAYWLDQINRYRVTIWNSVPILLDMLLVVAESRARPRLPLRQVMLSGDWIGLDLPSRLENVTGNCRLVAMGGATEAAIWSNYFDVTLPLPENWTSIPYGRALANQAYRIVDSKGLDCPDWVAGELWIGGAGVARGYRGEPELTAQRFVAWNGSRWYRTGDLGRYWPDGNIEFLGREDFQVKIRGHRIELGEIEAAMRRHAGVRDAVVTTADVPPRGKRLVGYVVPEKDTASSLFDVEEADGEAHGALWRALTQTRRASEKAPPDPELASAFWETVEDLSTVYICRALIDAGAFTEPGQAFGAATLVDACAIQSRYARLVERWLTLLESDGVLQRSGADRFVNPRRLPVNPPDSRIAPELAHNARWQAYADKLVGYLERGRPHFVRLLRGEVDPLKLFFSDEPLLAPEYLIQLLPGADYINEMVREILALVLEQDAFPKPLRILEVGARTGAVTEVLLPMLPPEHTRYTYSDVSAFFTDRGREKFKAYGFVDYQVLDIDHHPRRQGFDAHCFDIVIAPNALHRLRNIESGLNHLRFLLAPGGLLMALEMTRNSRLQDISVGYMDATDGFRESGRPNGSPLISVNEWDCLFRSGGFETVAAVPEASSPEAACYYQHIMAARAPLRTQRFNPENLVDWLRRHLPEYMLPSVYMPLDALPLTANGKVDRMQLPGPEQLNDKADTEFVAPRTTVEASLAEIWRQVLNLDHIGIGDHFFQLGGDSLLAVQLTTRISNAFNVDVSLERLFQTPTIAELAGHINGLMSEQPGHIGPTASLAQIIPDERNLHEPFPLTDIQQAYWIGRSGVYELGNVSTHCYFEIEGIDLDPERISRAWQRLIDQHGMMRAVILPDGQRQRILESVPPYHIQIIDLRRKGTDTVETELTQLREEMSHQVISTDQWPLFDVRMSRFGENRTRLHVSFENLIFDGWSMFHLLREWTRLYEHPDAGLSSLDLSFRDYVLALENLKASELYQRDQAYWMNRLPDLPTAPKLPLAQDPGLLSQQRFGRLDTRLDRDSWRRLKNRSRAEGLTPSGFLLTAYAEVLSVWSRRPQFTINLTLFNRLPVHPQVNAIVGDFTSLTLLAVDCASGKTFLQRALHLQQQLWQDLDHPFVSGVQVQRDLAKQRGQQQAGAMPVVFTSALGMEAWHNNDTGRNWMGKLVYNITQTPQVWLDHQVVEQDGALLLIWDAVQGLFPPGLLDDMFTAYCDLLQRLAGDETAWRKNAPSLVAIPRTAIRAAVNATDAPVSSRTLTDLFRNQASRCSQHPAVIASDLCLNYGQLNQRSEYIAGKLRQKGIAPGQLIGVVMEKGWEQVAAALGILKAGAAYLPIDPATPKERLDHLLQNGEAALCLTQPWLKTRLPWPETTQCLIVEAEKAVPAAFSPDGAATPEDLAYVIYTSGSTGLPKGVMIDHRGAVNTILDVNKRFSVGPQDRVLALSNLNFDLSVYDIFGLLASGGTIVMPEAGRSRDPAHWLELMRRERVTVWNTVPALMQMLVEYVSGRDDAMPQSLRLVLLSGDWIPLDLPEKIQAMIDDVRVIGLGGATEASIWSNLYPIEAVRPEWKSIPYGKPMANQRLYVLNQLFEACPDWVPGQLYIAGIGLAKGYWRDEKKTADSFIRHPRTDERLYRTGDLGRYLPDGTIEFLGREDFQVKIRGHRIELGEIEAALKQHPVVREAVVATIGDDWDSKRLAGYVVADQEKVDKDEMDRFLRQKLPDYMVPSTITVLDKIPLTSNGKADRQALPVPEEAATKRGKITISPRTQMEVSLAHIWAEVLNINRVGIYDNFFELGGDSLLAVQFVSQVHQVLQVALSLRELFESPNIAELSRLIEKKLKAENILTHLPEIAPDPENRYQPFPLTDIQQAYWIGRSGDFELGNIATHLYFEIDSKHLNLEQLNRAWQRVVDRHDMLRAVFLPDGRQMVLEQVPPYQFKVMDLRYQNQKMVAAELAAIRHEMSHQVLPAEKWPLFDIRASRLEDGLIRLHFSWDALIADAWSFFAFTSDWYEIYRNPEIELTPFDMSFRDYVLAEADLRDSELYRRAENYWSRRLSDLPPAPELPLAREPASIKQPRFNRRGFTLPADVWQNLKGRAIRNSLTPSGLLIAAYADVLSVWSKSPRFTINLTLFNRLPLHPQVNDIVGDFTSTILLGVESSEKEGFAAKASRLQRQLWQDMDHRCFSGIKILRELARLRGDFKKSAMPVVFTSALNLDALGRGLTGVNKLGEMVYGISQTPQVWLDHQVYEQDGDLVLTWDAVEELFPEGLLDDMFAAYCGFLQRLAEEEEAWQKTARRLIPAAQLEKRAEANATVAPVSSEMLHTLFWNQVSRRPDHPAVKCSNRTLSYAELSNYSNYIGRLLREKGAEPDRLVAVSMEKGWEQVAAVLGILNSRAAYLPIDPGLPRERIWHLLADGEIDLLLTQSWLDEKRQWPEHIQRVCVDKIALADEGVTPLEPAQRPDDLAYVIYTSGSTGFPKGVMISHQGAVNTVLDINKRFELGPEDKILAISNLNFDLSVYDIFGILAAGGTIVFPDPDKTREPGHWLDLITNDRITVWNSVPTLMQMLVEYLAGGTDTVPQSLRLVLLSGDWIPVDLPDKIKRSFIGARVIGLGGATEASIWSNLYPIEKVDPDWRSIPYGYPMLNQRYHVLNEFMEDCPEWVPGRLYIGGLGLAKGYWRDEEKTKNSFIVCPRIGERLYRTGDFGRYLSDGSIEFLGREDYQVKINGYRIECGEIESALKRLSGVKDTVVIVTDGVGREKQLLGYVVPNDKSDSILFEYKHGDPAGCASRWESIRDSGQKHASQIPGSIDVEMVPAFINSVEHLSFVTMYQILHDMGIFSSQVEEYAIDELMHGFRIQPRFQTLIRHWLDVLEEEKVLEKTETGGYLNRQPLNKEERHYASKLPKELAKLYSSLWHHIPVYIDLLKGNIDPVELLLTEDTFLTAERLERIAPGREYYINLAGSIFSAIMDSFPSDKQVRILEVGTRAGNLTGTLLSLLPKKRGCYLYTDESSVFTEKVREKVGDISSLELSLLDMNKAPGAQGYELYTFDVIIADKTLHRTRHLERTLKYVRELLAPGGLLFLMEPTQNNRLMLITVGFFEDGFSHFEDERKARKLPFIPVEKWHGLLEKTGFSKMMTFPEDGHAAGVFGQHLIVAQAPETVRMFEPSNIGAALRQKLPSYMVPARYMLLGELPLSANMKVDRKALEKMEKKAEPISEKTYVAPFTEIQINIARILKEMLGNARVGIHDNFFELGGDSLRAIQCINLLKAEYPVELSLQEFFEEANVERLGKKIEEKLEMANNLDMEEGEI